jgi:hypothetical protein
LSASYLIVAGGAPGGPGYGGYGGVGINLADQSGGIVATGYQAGGSNFIAYGVSSGTITIGTTLYTGIGSSLSSLGNVTALGNVAPNGVGAYTVSGTATVGNATVIGGISYLPDTVPTNQPGGGFLYIFANSRYFVIQGKSFTNGQTQWLGCCEFERAQPEDASTGLGVTTGISYYTGNPITATPGIAVWPCYAYFNGNRFPVGSGQQPTSPVVQARPVHGGIFAIPRARASTGDLVGLNAHVYSAVTITTGLCNSR